MKQRTDTEAKRLIARYQDTIERLRNELEEARRRSGVTETNRDPRGKGIPTAVTSLATDEWLLLRSPA